MSEIAAYLDEAYICGEAPITKREIRVLTIALLGILVSGGSLGPDFLH